jgi:hypothetical protein
MPAKIVALKNANEFKLRIAFDAIGIEPAHVMGIEFMQAADTL